MRWILAAIALTNSASAIASENSYCNALLELKEEAIQTNTPQRISIYKEEAFTFACGRDDKSSAQKSFCSAALPIVGLEFTHVFPWSIHSCLRGQGVNPGIETVDQYTGIRGRKKLKHLWATWKDGTHVDIQFEPTGDFSNDDEFKDYWGVYRMVIWQP